MNRSIIGIAGGILLFIAGINLWMNLSPAAIYVVDNKALFEGFEITKNYERKLDEMEASQRHVLDSLDHSISRMQGALEGARAEGKDNPTLEAELQRSIMQYRELRGRFGQALSQATSQFDGNIWKQIEPLLKEFAEARGYDFLLGKGSMDDIYHYPQQRDVTEEALQYINENHDKASE